MADESKLVDAILAAYNEEHAHIIKSFAIITELVPDLVEEGLIQYTRVGEEIDGHHAEQKEQQILIELEQFRTLNRSSIEYVARLLAVIEVSATRELPTSMAKDETD